jgi:hypothetical protein
MIYEFYPWKINVNKEETIKYYQTEDMSMAREINNIVNAKMTKGQKDFFENLGVDTSKILIISKLGCFELKFYVAGNVIGLPKSQKEALESVFPIICPNDVKLYETDNFLFDIDGMALRFKHPCSYLLDETYDKWNCGFFYGMAMISNDGSSFAISEEFHEKYYDDMYDKNVKVTLKNGRQIVGLYNDEFYEDASILVNYEVVKIEDIEKVELIGEEIQ